MNGVEEWQHYDCVLRFWHEFVSAHVAHFTYWKWHHLTSWKLKVSLEYYHTSEPTPACMLPCLHVITSNLYTPHHKKRYLLWMVMLPTNAMVTLSHDQQPSSQKNYASHSRTFTFHIVSYKFFFLCTLLLSLEGRSRLWINKRIVLLPCAWLRSQKDDDVSISDKKYCNHPTGNQVGISTELMKTLSFMS